MFYIGRCVNKETTNISLFSFPLDCQDKKQETAYLEYASMSICRYTIYNPDSRNVFPLT